MHSVRKARKKHVENDSLLEIRSENTSSLDDKLNVKDYAVKMLENRLKVNFASKNVLNLSRRNLTNS